MGVDVLVVGGGGREHALAWAISRSLRVGRLALAPGNGGTSGFAESITVPPGDIAGQVEAARRWKADFVVVGPDLPVVTGLVDALGKVGIRAFGPVQAAAMMEGSKEFAKQIMAEAGVPTAAWQAFDDPDAARRFVREQGAPIVIKADGLAAGKGVTVALTVEDAEAAIREAMENRKFGESGARIVVEEFMEGREVTVLALVDGETVLPLPPTCDYKRIGEGELGPNTGGVGGYTAPPWFGRAEVDTVRRTIIEPVVGALTARGIRYRGCLYTGLMVTRDGPKVVEFNARFGDPETQTIVPLLESDLLTLLEATADGSLASQSLQIRSGCAVDVVLTSKGYPGEFTSGFPIAGLDQLPDDILVFHAGTRRGGDQILTDGGRVLNVVALGDTLAAARDRVYAAVEQIQFTGRRFRRDIALREVSA